MKFKIIIGSLCFALLIITAVYLLYIKNLRKEIQILHNQNKYIVKLFSNGLRDLPSAYEPLRSKQQDMLKALVEFDKFAHENKIEYWLDFGTLLGSYRHKGFIPWDDDIDISMSSDNLSKLLELAKNPKLNIDVSAQYDNERGALWFFTNEHGTFDIFSHVCTSTEQHRDFINYVKYYSGTKKFKYFRNKRYEYIDNIQMPSCSSASSNDIILMRNISTSKGENIYNSFFAVSDIYPIVKAKFEGYEFPVPHNSYNVLKTRYGSSFMNLPDNFGYSHLLHDWN